MRGQESPDTIRGIRVGRYCCGVSGMDDKMYKGMAKDLGTSNEQKCLDGLVEGMAAFAVT